MASPSEMHTISAFSHPASHIGLPTLLTIQMENNDSWTLQMSFVALDFPGCWHGWAVHSPPSLVLDPAT